jgi:hypothetical protein
MRINSPKNTKLSCARLPELKAKCIAAGAGASRRCQRKKMEFESLSLRRFSPLDGLFMRPSDGGTVVGWRGAAEDLPVPSELTAMEN